ncbi:MAG: hypothetical protein OEZ10_12150 [Gammaproteobacteria bacterium]|nr:hypothetical protein [Gammaproteobacteria bacterium]
MLHAAGRSSEDERRDVYVFGPIDWTTATEEYQVELGIFPAKSLLVKAGHYKSEGITEIPLIEGYSWDSSTEGNSLSLKYVGRPGSQYVNLEAFYEASKHEFSTIKHSTKALGVLGDYYFTRDLSLGAGYVVVESDLDGDVDEFNVLSLNGTYFIFPSLSVTMQYNRVDNDDSVKNYSIKVATRF